MSMSLPDRIKESDIIALIHIHTVVSNDDFSGGRYVAFAQIEHAIKGASAKQSIEIEFGQYYSCGIAWYEVGEHSVVFLRQLDNGRYITVNAKYGKFQREGEFVVGWPYHHETLTSLQTVLMTLTALITPQHWSLSIDGLSVFIQPFCPSPSATGIPDILFFVKNVSQKDIKLLYDAPIWNVILTDLQGMALASLQYAYYADEARGLILPLEPPQHLVGLHPGAIVMYHLYGTEGENLNIKGTFFISVTAEKLYGKQLLTTGSVKITCQDSQNQERKLDEW